MAGSARGLLRNLLSSQQRGCDLTAFTNQRNLVLPGDIYGFTPTVMLLQLAPQEHRHKSFAGWKGKIEANIVLVGAMNLLTTMWSFILRAPTVPWIMKEPFITTGWFLIPILISTDTEVQDANTSLLKSRNNSRQLIQRDYGLCDSTSEIRVTYISVSSLPLGT